MSYTNPYHTLLREVVQPMIMNSLPDQRPSTDPFLSLLHKETVEGIQTDTAGRVDIFSFNAQPAIVVGDRRMYKPGTRDLGSGTVKLQFLTEQIKISEDQLIRMRQTGQKGMIARSVDVQRRTNQLYLISQLHKYGVDPWGGITTSEDYNKEIIGMYASSSAGTMTDPSDFNDVAGTPKAYGTLNLSGTAQTINNLHQIISDMKVGFKKIDFNSKIVFPYSKIYCLAHPIVAEILNSCYEILDATNKLRATITYSEMMTKQGVTIVESVWADSDYAKSTGNTSQLKFYTDPDWNYNWVINVPPPGVEVWSPWERGQDEVGGKTSYFYESHKSYEMGFYSTPYYFYTAAATASFFKALYVTTVTPYEDT